MDAVREYHIKNEIAFTGTKSDVSMHYRRQVGWRGGACALSYELIFLLC